VARLWPQITEKYKIMQIFMKWDTPETAEILAFLRYPKRGKNQAI
jgi:hypothetical protein